MHWLHMILPYFKIGSTSKLKNVSLCGTDRHICPAHVLKRHNFNAELYYILYFGSRSVQTSDRNIENVYYVLFSSPFIEIKSLVSYNHIQRTHHGMYR